MTPAQLKALFLGLLLLAVVSASATAVISYKRMTARLAVAEQDAALAKGMAQESQKLYTQLSTAVLQRDTAVSTIRAGAQADAANLDEVRHEDPEAGRYLDAPIPDSVRRAYTKGHAAEAKP